MRNYKWQVSGLLVASIAATLFSTSAVAAINYSFAGGSGQTVTGSSFSAAGGPNVVVTAWSNTVAAGAPGLDDDKLAAQTVKLWNGLGVSSSGESTSSPQHSTDNSGPVEMVLFSFAADIALAGVSIGWSQTDSDMTVLAYTGGGAPSLAGKTYSQLTAVGGGWSLISHLSNVSNVSSNSASIAGSAAFNTGASPIFSSYWLVGAYNPIVGSSPGWTRGDDFVKISGLTGSTKPTGGGQVPEPATLLLMGAGLLGMTYVRRRETPVKSEGKTGNTLSC